MNLLHSILPLGLALASVASAETPQSLVRFANKDVLPGTPESIGPELLMWSSPLLAKPAAFLLDKVLDVSLSPTPAKHTADHEATVTLTNGDSIRGQLASVTGDIVSLDTAFAGRLDFKRPMVSTVKIEQRADFLFQGPSGLDGWQQSTKPPAWSYRQSYFQSSAEGGIARADLLPDECALSFDVAWKSDAIRLKVILFSDDPTTDTPSSGYELSFQRGGVHLRNCKTQNYLGSAQCQALMENDKVHVEIRASLKSNRVALLVDDRLIEVWNDPDANEGRFGHALHFISGSPRPLRLSKIGIARWDGVIDRMPEPRPGFNRRFGFPQMQDGEDEDEPSPDGSKEKPGGRMELANGDTLQGEVLSISEGVITIKTALGEVKLPVSRLRTVMLKPVEPERCKRYKGDVRGWLPDGSSIVFRLDASDRDTLTGFSQNFGSASFRISAFSRIEFNIYTPDYEDLRVNDTW